MKYTVSKILETAVRINRQIIEAFLVEEQTKSGYSDQVFFGMLNDEIQVVSMKFKTKGEKYEWFKQFDDVLPVLELNDMLKFFSEFESRVEQFELVGEIVNKLFEQSISDTEVKPNPDESNIEYEEVPLENKFNTMPMVQVRSFFKPLVTKKNRDGKHWMTEEDFEIFLKRSFGKIDLPKPNINFGKSDKGAIKKLFFLFYEECLIESISENNSKDRFIPLLKNAFNTPLFDELTNDTFQKRDSKYEWGM